MNLFALGDDSWSIYVKETNLVYFVGFKCNYIFLLFLYNSMRFHICLSYTIIIQKYVK